MTAEEAVSDTLDLLHQLPLQQENILHLLVRAVVHVERQRCAKVCRELRPHRGNCGCGECIALQQATVAIEEHHQ
jgi:hypothetical protein